MKEGGQREGGKEGRREGGKERKREGRGRAEGGR